jgi:hypothetical protein
VNKDETKTVLNPALYRRCRATFKRVKVVNPGVEQTRKMRTNLNTGKREAQIEVYGEAYAVCCPLCPDTRFRLYVNHRYGMQDESGFYQTRLAHCFNGGCLLSTNPEAGYERLEEILTGHNLTVFAGASLRKGKQLDLAKIRSEWPGKVTRVDKLPADHPASIYLVDRGFDPEVIGRLWNVHLCYETDKLVCQDRLIIPIYHNKKMVGWQARATYDCNWKDSWLPKYYTAPGTPRRQILYNLGNASKYETGIIVEGVTDVWRIGRQAVCTLGAVLTPQQETLFRKHFKEHNGVLLYDPDLPTKQGERQAARLDEAIDRLAERLKSGFCRVSLPEGTDPGSLDREFVRSYIAQEAKSAGVAVSWRRRE